MPSWWSLDLRALALMRMLYGAILVIDVLIRASDLLAHYTDLGLAPRDFILQNYQDPWQFSVYLANGQLAYVAALFAVAAGAGFCLTIGYHTRVSALICWMGTPPIRISPEDGRSERSSSFSSVDFPVPDGPTMATDSPGSSRKVRLRITGGSPFE